MVEHGGNTKVFRVKTVTGGDVDVIIRKIVVPGSEIMTDEYKGYDKVGEGGYIRSFVNHSRNEYVRCNTLVNTIEGEWTLFKRGIYGIYHHISGETSATLP